MRHLMTFGFVTFVVLASVIVSTQLHLPSRQLPVSSIDQSSTQDINLTAENSQKLAPNLRLQLSQLSPEADPQVNILLRTTSVLDPNQQAQLEAIGANVRTVAGDIVTASITARQIPELAELEFIRYIELSSPLYPESP